MRIAVVSDIHGNLTAFQAVLADLRETSPDLVLHGGDLAANGARAAEVVDLVRDLGWRGVAGNTDEVLWDPAALDDFASRSQGPQSLFAAIGEIAAATRDTLGEERIAWLRELPRVQIRGPLALVHASPGDLWRAPAAKASDEELASVYGPLGCPVAVYAHIHCPFIRHIPAMTVANSGSVSLSHDGDRRASYLLLDESTPMIRRVEYDVEREIGAISISGMPYAGWMAKMLASASPQVP